MTKIKFFKNKDIYTGFECLGHAKYDDYGKDVLCAAISSLTQGCALGIIKVVGVNANITKKDEEGYIKLELPKSLNEDKLRDSQLLIKTLICNIKDLTKGYSKYIKMEVIENVY